MKKYLFSFLLLLSATCFAQSPKQVLDQCATVVGSADGFQASFRMESAQYGNTSGTIFVKGRKFHASTPVASMWFDGTTQWTYLERNNEVSVVTPNENQMQAFNPYNFINLYKEGYKSDMTKSSSTFNVHLTATNPNRKLKELFITVNKKNYHPTVIKMLQGQRWTTFYVDELKVVKQADSIFRFNPKDFPSVEIVDLR